MFHYIRLHNKIKIIIFCFYLLLITTKSLGNPVEQPMSAVENAREQIKLLVEEYKRLCFVTHTDAVQQCMNDINNEMIPHFATLDAAN